MQSARRTELLMCRLCSGSRLRALCNWIRSPCPSLSWIIETQHLGARKPGEKLHNTTRRSFWVLRCILQIRLLHSVRKAVFSVFVTHRRWHCVWICYEEFGAITRGAVPPRYLIKLLLVLTFCFFALNVHDEIIVIFKGAQIFQKSTNSPRIIGARWWREASSIMSTHIFYATLQNWVALRQDDLTHGLCVLLGIWRLFSLYVGS